MSYKKILLKNYFKKLHFEYNKMSTTTVNGEQRPVCGVCRSTRSWGGVIDCNSCGKYLCTTGCKCACKNGGTSRKWNQ